MNIKSVKLSEIKIAEPFSSLFPIGADPLDSITIDIETNGFDDAFPIIVWEEKNLIVDGHTRFNAAIKLELEEIPVLFKRFDNEDDAILYAFHLQRNRRNLSDEDILRCLHLLDNMKPPVENDKKEIKKTVQKKESAEVRAKELGTSKSKIEKARKVLEHASDDIKEAVGTGEKSINKAFNEMQEIRRGSGELKTGSITTSLACSNNYKKALEKLTVEIKRIKEEGWQQATKEKILLDLDTIKNIIS